MTRCTIVIPQVQVAAGVSDSIIVLHAPTGRKIKVAAFGLWANGSDPSKQQGKIEICRCSTDQVGGTAITSDSEPVNGDVAFDPDTVIFKTVSTEPTTVTPIRPYPLHPGGSLERSWSLEQEMIESAISGGICIRWTPVETTSIDGFIEWGEA